MIERASAALMARSAERTNTNKTATITGCKNAFMLAPLLLFLLLLRRSSDHVPGRIRLAGVFDRHMPAINRDGDAHRILHGLQLEVLFVDLFLLVRTLFFDPVYFPLLRDNPPPLLLAIP